MTGGYVCSFLGGFFLCVAFWILNTPGVAGSNTIAPFALSALMLLISIVHFTDPRERAIRLADSLKHAEERCSELKRRIASVSREETGQ
jgi:hypothetical protein